MTYCFEMLPVKAGDHIVSMLPMGHVFGMVYDFLYGFSAGAHIYFLTRMPSPKIIAQSFAEIKAKSDLLCTFDRRENYQKRYSSESGQQNR